MWLVLYGPTSHLRFPGQCVNNFNGHSPPGLSVHTRIKNPIMTLIPEYMPADLSQYTSADAPARIEIGLILFTQETL